MSKKDEALSMCVEALAADPNQRGNFVLTEAERLAQECDLHAEFADNAQAFDTMQKAAAELRRLASRAAMKPMTEDERITVLNDAGWPPSMLNGVVLAKAQDLIRAVEAHHGIEP